MITIESYENRFPILNNQYFDSLNEDEKNQYFSRLTKYYYLLNTYVIKTLSLDEIENSLSKSDKCYLPILENNLDFYQALGSTLNKYFYVRNNIYIERLTSKELIELDNITDNYDDFVKATYKRLIGDYPGKRLLTNYGPDSMQYYADSSHIILGFRYRDDYYPDNVDQVDLVFKRKTEIEFLQSYISAKAERIMKEPVSIIHYTSYLQDMSLKNR